MDPMALAKALMGGANRPGAQPGGQPGGMQLPMMPMMGRMGR